MKVFKVYFKIINYNKKQLIIYAAVFLAFAIMFSFSNSSGSEDGFTGTRCKLAIINDDEDSRFLEGLKEYIGLYSEIVDIENDDVKIQNALFYRDVEYVIKVPKGYTEEFMNGQNPELLKNSVPDSYTGYYVEMLINKYLNTAKIYLDSIEGLTETKLIELTKDSLESNVEITMKSDNSDVIISESLRSFSDFSLYPIYIVVILGSCAVMYVFVGTNIKERNLVSPMRLYNSQGQLILGNLIYAIVIWGIFSLAAVIFYSKFILSSAGALVILNILICVLVALSIGYLLSNLIKKKGTANSLANLVGLGSAFLGGAFVSQDMLSSSVLKLASFTPGYWYVKANDDIIDAVNLNSETLRPIFTSMLIQVGFAVMFLAITLVYVKNKRVVKAIQ